MAEKATERMMLDLLLRRYTSVREGTVADRWVRAEHVRRSLGQAGGHRIADFIAADKYPGIPYGSAMALHGHEVKVSRGDFLSELRDLDKSETFKRHMHHWWLVVSDLSIVKPEELPEGWGLLVAGKTSLRMKVKAPRLTPEPIPTDLTISLMAAAQKTAYREPLHRDAPTSVIGRYDARTRTSSWTSQCGWCAQTSPCTVHQPRLSLASEPPTDVVADSAHTAGLAGLDALRSVHCWAEGNCLCGKAFHECEVAMILADAPVHA